MGESRRLFCGAGTHRKVKIYTTAKYGYNLTSVEIHNQLRGVDPLIKVNGREQCEVEGSRERRTEQGMRDIAPASRIFVIQWQQSRRIKEAWRTRINYICTLNNLMTPERN